MTLEMIVFAIVALITLAAAVMVVTTKNIFYAALWLILPLFGVAVIYVLLNMGFLAMVQVIIYVGAIAILFIFAIMLVNPAFVNGEKRFNEDWLMALILAGVLFVAFLWLLSRWAGFLTVPATSAAELANADPVRALGVALVSPDKYLIPFELASVLLIAAMIGAIYVAWGKTWKKK